MTFGYTQIDLISALFQELSSEISLCKEIHGTKEELNEI
jgi:hypothetical protein